MGFVINVNQNTRGLWDIHLGIMTDMVGGWIEMAKWDRMAEARKAYIEAQEEAPKNAAFWANEENCKKWLYGKNKYGGFNK